MTQKTTIKIIIVIIMIIILIAFAIYILYRLFSKDTKQEGGITFQTINDLINNKTNIISAHYKIINYMLLFNHHRSRDEILKYIIKADRQKDNHTDKFIEYVLLQYIRPGFVDVFYASMKAYHIEILFELIKNKKLNINLKDIDLKNVDDDLLELLRYSLILKEFELKTKDIQSGEYLKDPLIRLEILKQMKNLCKHGVTDDDIINQIVKINRSITELVALIDNEDVDDYGLIAGMMFTILDDISKNPSIAKINLFHEVQNDYYDKLPDNIRDQVFNILIELDKALIPILDLDHTPNLLNNLLRLNVRMSRYEKLYRTQIVVRNKMYVLKNDAKWNNTLNEYLGEYKEFKDMRDILTLESAMRSLYDETDENSMVDVELLDIDLTRALISEDKAKIQQLCKLLYLSNMLHTPNQILDVICDYIFSQLNKDVNMITIEAEHSVNREIILVSLIGLIYNYYDYCPRMPEGHDITMYSNIHPDYTKMPEIICNRIKKDSDDITEITIPRIMFSNILRSNDIEELCKIDNLHNIFGNIVYPISDNDIEALSTLNTSDAKYMIVSDLHGKFVDLVRLLIILGYMKLEKYNDDVVIFNAAAYLFHKPRLIFLGDVFNYKLLEGESREFMTPQVAGMYELMDIFHDNITYIRGNHCRYHIFNWLRLYDNKRIYKNSFSIENSLKDYITTNIVSDDGKYHYLAKYLSNMISDIKNNYNISGLFALYSTDYINPMKEEIVDFIHSWILELKTKYIFNSNMPFHLGYDLYMLTTNNYYYNCLMREGDYWIYNAFYFEGATDIYCSHENLIEQYLRNIHELSTSINKVKRELDRTKKYYECILALTKTSIIKTEYVNCLQEIFNCMGIDDSFGHYSIMTSLENVAANILTIINKKFKNINMLNIHGHIGTFINYNHYINRVQTDILYKSIFMDYQIKINSDMNLTTTTENRESLVSTIPLDVKNQILHDKAFNENDIIEKYNYLPFSIDVTYIDSTTTTLYTEELYKIIGNIAYILISEGDIKLYHLNTIMVDNIELKHKEKEN